MNRGSRMEKNTLHASLQVMWVKFIDKLAMFICILCLKCVEQVILAFRDLVMFGDRTMHAFLTKA